MSWNGNGSNASAAQPAQKPTAAKKSPSVVKGIVAGAVVVGLSVVALLFIFKANYNVDESTEGKGRSKIKSVALVKPKSSFAEPKEKRTSGSAIKASDAKKPAAGLDAAMNLVPRGTNMSALIVSPISKHLSDQVLLMATSAVGDGDDMPPLPNNAMSEKDFRESLKTKIVIEENDSEDVKKLKQRIIDARQKMQQMLDDGMSVNEVLKEHERIVHENAATRKQVMDELRAIVESGDVEGAKKYRTTMNIALEQMGIRKLTTPITQEEIDEQKAARKARLLERREQMLNGTR